MVCIPLGYIPRSQIARLKGMTSFNFMELEIWIPKRLNNLFFHPQCMRQ